jgi:hypothetical protein
LVEQGHATVFSGDQLTFKINRLRSDPDIRRRILEELAPGPYSAKNATEAVERVLEFDRTWASFEFPRLLKAVEDVQSYILRRRSLASGEYGLFANQVENLFRQSFQVPLEEYGLPLQLTDKLTDLLRGVETIDEALDRLRRLRPDRSDLDSFEQGLLKECQPYL